MFVEFVAAAAAGGLANPEAGGRSRAPLRFGYTLLFWSHIPYIIGYPFPFPSLLLPTNVPFPLPNVPFPLPMSLFPYPHSFSPSLKSIFPYPQSLSSSLTSLFPFPPSLPPPLAIFTGDTMFANNEAPLRYLPSLHHLVSWPGCSPLFQQR